MLKELLEHKYKIQQQANKNQQVKLVPLNFPQLIISILVSNF